MLRLSRWAKVAVIIWDFESSTAAFSVLQERPASRLVIVTIKI